MSEIIDLKDIIGVCPLFNTGALLVHKIDYTEDKILVSTNGKDREWCDMIEGCADGSEELEIGFKWGELFVPFADVMRMTEEV